MCGISGIVTLNSNSELRLSMVKGMIKTLKHRGPDSEGYYNKGNITLGHCRLSIIDLSLAGIQPMCNEDKTIWLTYNGEIYNYKDLKIELMRLGHLFKSNTDSEVIIHAYEEWGVNCLKKFNGMWSFAIWDEKNKKLFCARDRFGEKPFYYYKDNSKFIFGSEIKAIRSVFPENTFLLNEKSAREYLISGKTENTNETLFNNIYKLKPSHYFEITSLSNFEITENEYWNFNVNPDIYVKNSVDDRHKVYDNFREIFYDSIKLRLISDVDLGSCLSGGLDSSSIVSVMYDLMNNTNSNLALNNKIGGNIKTFTAAFKEKWCDETEYSECTANFIKADQYKIYPEVKDIKHQLSEMILYHDEPFPSLNVYTQWKVMELASNKNVKVILDGQGGDELLGGYHAYLWAYFFELIKNKYILRFMREAMCFCDIFPYYSLNHYLRKLFQKIKLVNSNDNPFVKYLTYTIENKSQKYSDIKNMLKNHMQIDSIPDLLRYEDRNSMRFSIETRLPFLDFRLVEFVFSLPLNYLFNNGNTKHILRQAMKSKMPDKIINRRTKLGFTTPEAEWLINNKNVIHEVFNESYRIFGNYLLNRKRIIENIDLILSKDKRVVSSPLSRLFIFDLWLLINFGKKK